MVFRFANGIFEPVWNRRYIDHVQITVAETVGVEGRGGYYETAGALRDMVQNHLFQLLALTAMEPPNSFEPDRVRDERVKVLRAIRPFTPELVAQDVVRGQYVAGAVDGKPVPGYREEPTVAPTSTTETYVALKLLDRQLALGRRAVLPAHRQAPGAPRVRDRDPLQEPAAAAVPRRRLRRAGGAEHADRAHPAGRGHRAALPGQGAGARTSASAWSGWSSSTRDYFGATPSTGYETLLYDVMTGDPSLFHRADMVETGWEVVAPILDAWTKTPDGVESYPASSWGPPSAQALLARDGREWRTP